MSEEIDNLVMLALRRWLRLIDQEIELSDRICAAGSEDEFAALVQEQAAIHIKLENAGGEYRRLREIQKNLGL